MKLAPLATALATLLCTTAARAQSAAPSELPEEKSPLVALGLSAVTTAAGIGLLGEADDSDGLALLGAGMVIGGSYAGYLYTGDGDAAFKLALVQGAGVGALALGISAAFGDTIFDEGPAPELGAVLIYGGAATIVGGAIYGMVDSYRSANRANARARERALRIAPTPVVGPGHTTGVGVSVGGAF